MTNWLTRGGGEVAISYVLELAEPELIVLRSDAVPDVGLHEPTITRVELIDHGAKTRMTGPAAWLCWALPGDAGWCSSGRVQFGQALGVVTFHRFGSSHGYGTR
jgi:hypothetical protein